jgi:peroxiredoxin
LAKNYDKIQGLDAEIVGFHQQCNEAGTKLVAEKNKLPFPMVNDERLEAAEKYGLTSAYLIDKRGVVRGRWIDRIHARVNSKTVVEALTKLGDSDSAAKEK